jgi:hypothetical protein
MRLFDRAESAFYKKNSADLSISLRALAAGRMNRVVVKQMQLKR